jgi:cytochrome c oxidase cbb3-type subunit I/II
MKNSFDVPYTKAQIDTLDSWMDNQADKIVKNVFSEASDVKKSLTKRKQINKSWRAICTS